MGGPITKKAALRVVKAAVGLAVVVAVGRHAFVAWGELRSRGEIPRFRVPEIVGAIGLYLGGLAVFGVFFARVLNAGGEAVAPPAAIRAYLISHLAKYVPGKALVVVARTALVMPYGARPATAAFATLYETLVMMAAGGFVALAGLRGAASFRPQFRGWSSSMAVPLGLAGGALGLAFLVAVAPVVFRSLSRLPFPGVSSASMPRLSWGLLAEGLALATVGWVLLGLSQVAVIASFVPGGLPIGRWPVVVGAVALATVAGFVVAVAPGGLGVREWVLWTSLGGVLAEDLAVLASLALRLTWVAGEVAIALILLSVRPSPKRAAVSTP